MGRPRLLAVSVVAICLTLMSGLCDGEIHRAKKSKPNLRAKTNKYSHDEDIQWHTEEGTNEEWMFLGHSRETWIFAVVSAILVGLSGILPLFIIPLDAGKALQSGAAHHKLDLLLSFAVGGLLGDVFLHLLPEAWAHVQGHDHAAHTKVGLWIILGMLTFLIIEKIFPEVHDENLEEDHQEQISGATSTGCDSEYERHSCEGETKLRRSSRNKPASVNSISNGIVDPHTNGVFTNGKARVNDTKTDLQKRINGIEHIKTSGWLNLLANFIDNFTHGLAVAGSYCVDTKTGLITTAAILLHEIPHEIGDFAILLRAGFDRWRAAKAQLITAFGGLLGAVAALCAESAQKAGDSTAWILPFTSGGFIYIALVTVVPDLLKEENGWKSVKQVLLLCCGIFVMALVTLFC